MSEPLSIESEAALARRVVNFLLNHARVNFVWLKVRAEANRAILFGAVRTQRDKQASASAALRVSGVSSVDNRLSVIAEAWVSPRESRSVAPARHPALPTGRPRPDNAPRPRALRAPDTCARGESREVISSVLA